MKYLALDVETTGLDPKTDQLMMASFIIADTEYPDVPVSMLPSLTIAIDREVITFQQRSFAVIYTMPYLAEYVRISKLPPNKLMLVSTSGYEVFSTLEDVYQHVRQFLEVHHAFGKLLLAGKNVMAFDYPFLCQSSFATIPIHHRSLDPMMCFIRSADALPPDLATCCTRAGVSYDTKAGHSSLYDAQLVVELLRRGMQ